MSPSGGTLAGAARDLAAQCAVGSPGRWCRVAELGAWAGVGAQVLWRGGRRRLARRNTPASLLAGQAVTDQDLHRLVAWLGNRRHLAGVIAGLTLPARHRRPVVAVVAWGGILIGHSVAPKGAQYANHMAAAEAADEEAEAHIILCVVFVWWCVRLWCVVVCEDLRM